MEKKNRTKKQKQTLKQKACERETYSVNEGKTVIYRKYELTSDL